MRAVRGFALALIAIALPATALATAVDPAEFTGIIGWPDTTNDPAPGTLFRAGSLSWEASYSAPPGGYRYDASMLATLQMTGGRQPLLDIQGSYDLVHGAWAQGQIKYAFSLDKKDPAAPDTAIPVNITGRAHVSLSRGTGNTPWGGPKAWYGAAHAKTYTSLGMFIDIEPRSYYRPIQDVSQTVTGFAWPGTINYAFVYGQFDDREYPWGTLVSGNFQIIVDPIIEIDPTAMVNVNGALMPASEAYSLTFSEGFEVPEPSALILLGSGLAGLGAMTWRRARRSVVGVRPGFGTRLD